MLLLLLLRLQIVSGVKALNVELTPDGHLSMQHATKDGRSATVSDGTVMRRETRDEASLLSMEEGLEHALAVRKGVSHMDLRLKNASGMLLQAPQLEGGLKCNTPIFAPADACPFECPYLAEDSKFICHFRCLTATSCGSLDPLAKIADNEDKVCRRCKVMGCKDCIPGVKDVCRVCETGYRSDGKGNCFSPAAWVMMVVKIILALVILVGVLWILELFTRKRTNWRGFKHGVAFRWRTRIHMPLNTEEEDGVDDTDAQDEQIHEQLLYPLSTNLLRQPIAGPGLCLHMNFNMAVLIWAAVMIYAYSLTACMVSIDMLVLGLTPAKTSQQLCAVVHWGHDAQLRLVWAKTAFVVFAYLFTFLGCLALGVYQNHEFHRLDDETTMKDFVALVRGLPKLKGSDRAEDDLKKFIEEQTHETVRGVSICWNHTSKLKEVHEAIENDWKEREAVLAPALPDESVNPTARQPQLSWMRRQVRKADCIFGFEAPPTVAIEAPAASPEGAPAAPLLAAPDASAAPSGPSDSEITAFLNEMESSDCAFIIFDTEQARDDAVEMTQMRHAAGQGLEYKGEKISMEVKNCEPQSARFSGLAYGSNNAHRVKKLIKGVWATLGCLCVWVGLFYVPYAFYTLSFSYANGEEPSFLEGQLFGLLVVAGNQGMYFLADIVSVHADFGFEDDREVAYNYVYVGACVLNCALDLGLLLWMAYKKMVGMGVHTADDRLLANLGDFHEVFEAYPMQKVFGELLYEYSFPACFCYPFILEGLFTITVPYYVGKYIVLSHDEVQEREAELSMQYFLPMNLGRYGDIILNVILCVMVFFCPGGFTLPMFMAFFVCHACIYMYDHYRIIRCTPNFYFANNTVDWFGQLQLILPTAVLACCCVFRASQMSTAKWFDGPLMYVMCGLAFLGHCALHFLCLVYLVPLVKPPTPHEPSKQEYSDIAKNTAITWFSANPVHCLRSKHIFKHSPPAIHCIFGKEHLQKANTEIAAYFENTTYGGAYSIADTMNKEQAGDKQDEEDLKREAEEENDAP